MKIRADLVELMRQGFNNAEIAARLGVDPKTVRVARRALRLDNAPSRRAATPLERLYAEQWPTGTVDTWKAPRKPCGPDPDAAAHRAELLAALRRPAA